MHAIIEKGMKCRRMCSRYRIYSTHCYVIFYSILFRLDLYKVYSILIIRPRTGIDGSEIRQRRLFYDGVYHVKPFNRQTPESSPFTVRSQIQYRTRQLDDFACAQSHQSLHCSLTYSLELVLYPRSFAKAFTVCSDIV